MYKSSPPRRDRISRPWSPLRNSGSPTSSGSTATATIFFDPPLQFVELQRRQHQRLHCQSPPSYGISPAVVSSPSCSQPPPSTESALPSRLLQVKARGATMANSWLFAIKSLNF
ncbi:hypothetical protein F2Q70_00017469 [Brassica cretica]|nr:hypothetical protein F2Q70_00017469 [Brassica cretica]